MSNQTFNSKKILSNISNAWKLIDNKQINRIFVFKDFKQAINFMNQVAELAEDANHHPDIHLVDYKKVIIELTTHDVGGLSERDVDLARKIDEI